MEVIHVTVKMYQTKKGPRWMFNAHLGVDPGTGKRVIVTRRGFATKKEAESKLRDMKYEFDHGLLEGYSRETFQDAYDSWLPRYEKTVKESTLNKTLQYMRIDVLPAFATMRLDAIRPIDCQNFADGLSQKYKTFTKVYGLARRIYQYAYTVGMTDKQNPFDRVLLPKADPAPKKVSFMTRDELRVLLDAMKDSPKWYTYFFLLAHTGARRGEALAMRWCDVNFKEATWTISATVTLGIANTQYISTPKTQAGYRTIDLDPETMNVLKEWRASQVIQSLDGYVFATKDGKPLPVTKPYAYLKRIIKKNGLKDVTVHSFRHTHCSMLFEAGWSVKDVQERLGHHDMNTTMNIYLHVTETRKKKSMEEFVAYLNAE